MDSDGLTARESAVLERLVEHIRVVSFEAPRANSHTEWKRRILSVFDVCCAECGIIEADHEDMGPFHESGNTNYQPLVYVKSESILGA